MLEGDNSTAVIDFFKIGDVEQTGTEDLYLRVFPIFSVVINPDFQTLHTWAPIDFLPLTKRTIINRLPN